MSRFEGAVALVTGATRGIGRAIAERLAQEGATVIGTATSESGAAATTGWLQPLGGHSCVLDVTDAAACESLVDDITKEHGAISILVNNAGITRDMILMRMKDEDWAKVIDTDLTSVFRLSRAVIRGMMKARFGRIISVGSVVGAFGNFGQANYSAAKAGVMGFSKSLAKEVGSRGITVNVVAPGFIDTDMTKDLPEAARSSMMSQIPIGVLGTPADVAGAVAFLASRDANYITGTTLHVNGGLFTG